MTRFRDWQSRLQRVVWEFQGLPFQHGKADCALFTAAGVKAMTGVDLARGLRGYRTEAEGLRKVRAKGFKDHVDVFAQALPETARPGVGDVAVIPVEGGDALGLVQGRGVWLMHIDRGLVLLPRSWISRGYIV